MDSHPSFTTELGALGSAFHVQSEDKNTLLILSPASLRSFVDKVHRIPLPGYLYGAPLGSRK